MSMDNKPDEQKEEFSLVLAIKEDQIVVAPEGKVEVHIGIINQGVDEDYFEILVDGVPADWATIDSPVVHLAAGEAKQVILTIQPPNLLQNRAGQYPLDVRAVSQKDAKHFAVAHSSLTVAAYLSGGRIGVVLGSIYFSVAPGSLVTVPVLLQNNGLKEDSFQLNIEGLPASWISTSAVVTKLGPSASKEIDFTIQVPRSPEAGVGRQPFTIIFISQNYPDQKTDVECILTVAAFSKFSASLQPETLQPGQAGQISINNEGNTADTYSLNFWDPVDELLFEKEVRVSRKTSQPGLVEYEMVHVRIPAGERIQIQPGKQGVYVFNSRLKAQPIVGNEKSYPFTVKILSAEQTSVALPGEAIHKAFIPPWAVATMVLGSLVLCLLILIPYNNMVQAAQATQTAMFQQTQSAMLGSGDLTLTLTTLPTSSTQATQSTLTVTPTGTTIFTDTPTVAPSNTPLPSSTAAPTNTPLPSSTAAPTDTPPPSSTPAPTNTAVVVPTNTNTPVVIPTPTQTLPALQGVLVFASNRDGNPQIYAMNLANQSIMRLTNNSAINMQPAIASDSMRVAYVSNQNGNNEIYLTGLDRRPPVNLTNSSSDDQQPTWSPDGNSIAFTSNRDGNQEIYTMNSDGSNIHRLTNNPASDFSPSWFSVPRFLGLGSDEWIAFTSNRDGNQEIYKIKPDGTGLTNLTINPTNDYSPSGVVGSNLVAFVSDRDGNPEIYTMTADGGSPTNITNNSGQDLNPVLDPTGKWIAFASDRSGNFDIYVTAVTGGKAYDLTVSQAQDQYPGW